MSQDSDHIHYLPGHEPPSDAPALFGQAGSMPFHLALSLRKCFTIISTEDATDIAQVPFDQIEQQFKICLYGALAKAGYHLTPSDFVRLYSNPALTGLALEVAQGTFMLMHEAETYQPETALLAKATLLAEKLGITHQSPSAQLPAAADHQGTIIPLRRDQTPTA